MAIQGCKPRIIAEQYMVDESGYELKDYKLFCFDGFAKAMFIASDRYKAGEETKFDFFDMDFSIYLLLMAIRMQNMKSRGRNPLRR